MKTLIINKVTYSFKKKEINSSLIHSHKKRIEGFILAMVEKPEQINIYQDQHYIPRNTERVDSLH